MIAFMFRTLFRVALVILSIGLRIIIVGMFLGLCAIPVVIILVFLSVLL